MVWLRHGFEKMDEKFSLGKITVNVNDDHRFGTDAFLLADFASPLPSHTVCDLCSGCGVIPLFFCKGERPPKRIYAVELQSEAVELMKRSVEENGLQDRIIPVEADLCDRERLVQLLPREKIDMVTVNPPYYRENSGKERLSFAQRLARHEIACDLERVIAAAEVLLKYGGVLKMCHLPERLAEAFYLMQNRKITPKRLTLVYNKEGEKPWLALIEGKKGGKAGLVIEKPLIMRGSNGEYTEELRKIYEIKETET